MHIINPKKILISPLDWGLGHASRDIPIVQKLIELGHEVIIAGSGNSLLLLKTEFPQLKSIYLPSFNIKYSKGKSQLFRIILSTPRFIYRIVNEKKILKNIIKEHNIAIVISDNRYGLHNPNCLSVLITHQLRIKIPKSISFVEKLLQKINYNFIEKFDECWIPDYESEHNISGELAHPETLPSNVKFIGHLSRFEKSFNDFGNIKENDILVILSGPEPQRSILEKILIKQVSEIDSKAIFVRGVNEFSNNIENAENIEFIKFADSKTISSLIKCSKIIISRAGYSTIMDLVALSKSAILIPTPGQTEQEYLAEYVKNKGWFYTQKQNEINLSQAIFEL
ncbi:MAG: hypothetical protein A2033_14930, partial [Bacteroidetes bacterium GWA2_31_9]